MLFHQKGFLCDPRNLPRWDTCHGFAFVPDRQAQDKIVPVPLLWAVPAVILAGGVGYYLVRAVH
jgi:hypothetical protein